MSIFERVETTAIPERFTACSADPSRLWNEDVIVDEVLALAVEAGCWDPSDVPHLLMRADGMFLLVDPTIFLSSEQPIPEPISELSEALAALASASDRVPILDCCCSLCGHGEAQSEASHCDECERATGHAHTTDCEH
jgi:hypothetical protein